jgi:hypothetical protein
MTIGTHDKGPKEGVMEPRIDFAKNGPGSRRAILGLKKYVIWSDSHGLGAFA